MRCKCLMPWKEGPLSEACLHSQAWVLQRLCEPPSECVPADKGLLTGHLQSVCDVLHPGVKNLCSVAQSCPTLCNPMDCSLPGSTAHGIFQARILKWVAISYSKGSSWPKDQTHIFCVFCIGRWVLYHCTTWEAPKFKNKHLEIAI